MKINLPTGMKKEVSTDSLLKIHPLKEKTEKKKAPDPAAWPDGQGGLRNEAYLTGLRGFLPDDDDERRFYLVE